MTADIVLASASPHRRTMLLEAGVAVAAEPSTIDERAVEAAIEDSGMGADDVAMILAEAKATEVSERFPDALVIGADQTLSLDGEILHKASDMAGARRRLIALAGRTHHLNSAVVLATGGETVWRHVESPAITMRAYDAGFVGRYLGRVGDTVLSSVGAYQVERAGVQLMDRIEGDYFAVIGLPLLPLLAELRRREAIDG